MLVYEIGGCGHLVTVTCTLNFAPVLSKNFLDFQTIIECRLTLKSVHDMIRTYSYHMAENQTIFSKKVNLMKYQEQTYTLVMTRDLLFANFSGVSNFTMKSFFSKIFSKFFCSISSIFSTVQFNVCS